MNVQILTWFHFEGIDLQDGCDKTMNKLKLALLSGSNTPDWTALN